MAAISKEGLELAMAKAPITAKALADQVGISLTYACDIIAGRRTLKRNPELRRAIAEACGCPQHWIEHYDSEAA